MALKITNSYFGGGKVAFSVTAGSTLNIEVDGSVIENIDTIYEERDDPRTLRLDPSPELLALFRELHAAKPPDVDSAEKMLHHAGAERFMDRASVRKFGAWALSHGPDLVKWIDALAEHFNK